MQLTDVCNARELIPFIEAGIETPEQLTLLQTWLDIYQMLSVAEYATIQGVTAGEVVYVRGTELLDSDGPR